MGDLKYVDNAETKLTSGINNVDDPATFSVTAGTGALFPSLTGNQWFPLVVVDASGNYEKLRITARTVDSLTGTRAQGGTTKIAFAVGDACYMTQTDEFFDEYPQLVDLQEGKPHWCGIAGGSANAISLNGDPTVLAYATGQLFTFEAAATNTTAMTVNVDGLGVKSIVDLSGASLAANAVLIGGHYFIQYGGTDFILMNSVSDTFADLTVTGTLTLTGVTSDIMPAPSGTKVLFYEAAAPLDWTKETGDDDKALRIVSGSGGAAAGNVAFSTVFARTNTDSHTLLAAESGSPAHTHPASSNRKGQQSSGVAGQSGEGFAYVTQTITVSNNTPVNAAQGHVHPMDIRVQYMDFILCSKD